MKFEVARQASSPTLCASVRAVPWAEEAEQQLSRLPSSGCDISGDIRIFGVALLDKPGRDPIAWKSLKFEVARQASSPSLCASVQAVPWAEEDEQQLSRLASSVCEISGDVRIFILALLDKPGRDPIAWTSLRFEVARQISSPNLCASVRAVPCAD